jgi:hypothetical protein
MPGFLSAYEGTERVDLGRGYWADVKKCLSSAEMGAVEAAMGGRQRMDVGSGRQFVQLDTRAGRVEMVVASLIDWNLDGEDGTIWPLDPDKPPYKPGCGRRQSVDRLPGPVFDKIWKRCDDLNGQDSGEDRARFPDPGELGDPDGDGGAAGPGGLPDGAGVLAEAGPVEGSDPAPPAP